MLAGHHNENMVNIEKSRRGKMWSRVMRVEKMMRVEKVMCVEFVMRAGHLENSASIRTSWRGVPSGFDVRSSVRRGWRPAGAA